MAILKILNDGEVVSELNLEAGELLERYLLGRSDGDIELSNSFSAPCDAAVIRGGNHWVLVPRPGRGVQVNGVPLASSKILDHHDTVLMAGAEMRMVVESLTVLSAESPLLLKKEKCRVCSTHYREGDSVIHCPYCQLPHHGGPSDQHEDCWRLVGRCASHPFCGYVVRRGDGEAAR